VRRPILTCSSLPRPVLDRAASLSRAKAEPSEIERGCRRQEEGAGRSQEGRRREKKAEEKADLARKTKDEEAALKAERERKDEQKKDEAAAEAPEAPLLPAEFRCPAAPLPAVKPAATLVDSIGAARWTGVASCSPGSEVRRRRGQEWVKVPASRTSTVCRWSDARRRQQRRPSPDQRRPHRRRHRVRCDRRGLAGGRSSATWSAADPVRRRHRPGREPQGRGVGQETGGSSASSPTASAACSASTSVLPTSSRRAPSWATAWRCTR
jgi:hypothetical protein